jgi:hypothetical protein
MDKTTLPPSGDKHDYLHLSPYFWPNPDTPDSLPYVFRDGERLPETVLYAPGSERYDRTALQRMFDDVTVAALAWRVHGDAHYAEHAARLVRRWFIETETRMNPHLRYAQVRKGHNNELGHSTGIIEFKDVYYLLDAIRLIAQSGALSEAEVAAFRSWMRAYLNWLEKSGFGAAESHKANNHGTMYDLQVVAIGTFLNKPEVIAPALRRARERMLVQFDASGAQPEELRRTITRHYCCFNLQGWVTLARFAEACGDDLWSHTTSDGRGIGIALRWLIETSSKGDWPYPDAGAFEEDRFDPLARDFDRRYRGRPITNDERFAGRPRYHPTAGIAPYWMLAGG